MLVHKRLSIYPFICDSQKYPIPLSISQTQCLFDSQICCVLCTFFRQFFQQFSVFPPKKNKFQKTGTDCATHVVPRKVLEKEDFWINIVNYRNRNEENMEKVVRARLAAAGKMKNLPDTKNVYSNVVRTDVYVKDTGVTCF